MTAPTTKNTFSTPNSKNETAKQWLQRCLRKQPSVQPSGDLVEGGLRDRMYVKRPRTAPSTGTAADTSKAPAAPSIPVNVQPPLHNPSIQPPSRPPRPDSGVVRDVNAWLDASMSTPSPPLMGGIAYWRSATTANAKDTAGIQHAIPIVRDPNAGRPSTSHSQQAKPLRRRARRIQVQMPLLSRGKSNRIAARKQVNRRSNSVPVLAIPYEATLQGAPPTLVMRSRSFMGTNTRNVSQPTARVNDGVSIDGVSLEQQRSRYGSPASTSATTSARTSARTSEGEGSIEQRMHALFGRGSKSADSTRPSTAAANIARENSMGDLSDAPTYSSGPPPPSYRSRPASVLTTSSFGCIDGMNPEQRQISQQRAALQRTMKGKLKRFAQNFTT